MELTISGMDVARVFAFISVSLFLAMFFLFPVNDKPTTKIQIFFFFVVDAALFAMLFGFVRLNLIL